MAASIDRVLVLGCGYAGTAIATLARARGVPTLVQARSDERVQSLRRAGFEVLQRDPLDETIAEFATARTFVVVSFPPDGQTDARIAPALGSASALTYISSTSVYGDRRGIIDDQTPTADAPSARQARLLEAEQAYRDLGATVLRCPGIYGPDRGLHTRVLRGAHRIPGDGSAYLSRIHVEDLAQIVLASAERGRANSDTFVVGDHEPATHVEMARFLVDTRGAAMPGFAPLEDVHESLRADRRIDARRVLTELGITLRFPTYREGMA